MTERKGISSILSKVKPAAESTPEGRTHPTAFDKFMATSPLDAEPNLADIARQISTHSRRDSQIGSDQIRPDQTEHPNRAPESSTHDGHPNRTPEPGVRPEPSTRTEHPTRALGSSIRIGHPIRTPEPSTQPEHPQPNLIKLCPPVEAATLAQKTLLRYFQVNGPHVTNYDLIAAETDVPRGTVRRVVKKFVTLGMLEKRPWREGNKQGVFFALLHNRAPELNTRTEHPFRAPEPGTRNEHAPHSLKIDRLNTLSISQETLAMTWPHLVRAGFGADQMEQIVDNLDQLGKPTDRIVAGLDHAEWELENGKMLDKNGQPVTDPCSWVFTALARTGYYRRPKGYVSPEEQAAKDAEAEAKAVVAARQAAEQAQFEAWRDGLSPDELADALRGHPGGPKDAWLKKMWRDRRN